MNAGQWIVVSLAAFTCVVAVVIAATDLYRMWREDRDAKRLEGFRIADELHRHDRKIVVPEGRGKSTRAVVVYLDDESKWDSTAIDLTEPKGRTRLGIHEEEK